MKILHNSFFLLIFFATLLTYSLELIFANEFLQNLLKNKIKLDKSSETYKMASRDANFITREYYGAKKRIKSTKFEFTKLIGYGAVLLFFFLSLFKKLAVKLSQKHITLMKWNRFQQNAIEINYLCLIITGISTVFFFSSLKAQFTKPIDKILISLVFLSIVFLIILPLILMFINKLFKMYGARLLIACYLAYFIKASTEFISQTPVDLKEMKKITIDEFSFKVKDMLIAQKLENKVYKEKHPKKSINAALVGWGKKERIEIYGNHEGFTDEEFESILLHEIGHSKNTSLIKKVAVLFLLKLIEGAFLVFLYISISKGYCDENISKITAFIVLYITYIIFGARWLISLHKLTSQFAEQGADEVAKLHGYGNSLSNVLYNICVTSGELIQSTFLYNYLVSYHPTVFDRIEFLKKNNN